MVARYYRILEGRVELTVGQKTQEAEKFLAWLRRGYPANGANIKMIYRNTPQLRVGVEACVYQYLNVFKVEIALARNPRFVLRSVAHEYEHIRQVVNEKIPIHRFRKHQELAAWGFAMFTLEAYKKEVGERWEKTFGQ